MHLDFALEVEMDRTFHYSFSPPALDPIGTAQVTLSLSDIEDAGIREVLQTPGPALGSWALFDALLAPTGPNTPFTFREPLGQAREVKVALSGLFGRFIARAYLERYFGLTVFAHLGKSNVLLDARRRIAIVRKHPGDLPDWVASSTGFANLTIAEAKGCHDRPGPFKALARAWTQTQRVSITRVNSPVGVKRIAIATRWASLVGGVSTPMIAVRDPDETGVDLEPDDRRALFVGLLRRHVASLLRPLGHQELSDSLIKLTSSRQSESGLISSALAVLKARPESGSGPNWIRNDLGELVGGVVTRQGVVSATQLSPADERTLARLQLRPVFVGLERRVIESAIRGEEVTTRGQSNKRRTVRNARGDGAGGWVIPLDRA